MGYRSDVAFVLWKPDFEELVKRMRKVDEYWANYLEGNAKYMTTPDETYVKSSFEWVKWYDEYEWVDCINSFLREVRHAFVEIGEENDDIIVYHTIEDDRGVDEEFYEFLDVERRIIDYGFVPDVKEAIA